MSVTHLERSLRRSHVRARVLCILAARGEMYASHLIDVAGIDARRLRLALQGDGDRYRRDLSLLKLGLVEEIRGRGEVRYRATRSGRALAVRLVRERRMRQWP